MTKDQAERSSESGIVRRLASKEGLEFAELVLLKADLVDAQKTAVLWCERYRDPQNDAEAIAGQSLGRDVVVRFIACCGDSANPSPLFAFFQGTDDDGRNAFVQRLRDFRDAFIAHRFGPLRQSVTGLAVDENSGKFIGLAQMVMVWHPRVANYGEQLLAVIQSSIEYIDTLLEPAEQKCLEQARSMSVAQLAELPPAQFVAPSPSNVRTGRARFQNSFEQNKER